MKLYDVSNWDGWPDDSELELSICLWRA